MTPHCPIHIAVPMLFVPDHNPNRRKSRPSERIPMDEAEFSPVHEGMYRCQVPGCARVEAYEPYRSEPPKPRCKRCGEITDAPAWRMERLGDLTCKKCLKRIAKQRAPLDVARRERDKLNHLYDRSKADRKMFRRK